MPNRAPEISRLIPELFRRVGIPYAHGFSSSSQRALLNVVSEGLAGGRIARRQAVSMRLAKAFDGAQHLDEFAENFGFLEEASGSYFAGRFGLIGSYLQDVASRTSEFNLARAQHALLTQALIERHGDCVLPALAVQSSGEEHGNDEFRERVGQILLSKAEAWKDANLPRNAAYREGQNLYSEYEIQWGVQPTWPVRPSARGAQTKKREDKTLDGYRQRTIAYLHDLGYVSERSSTVQVTPTRLGSDLIAALMAEGAHPDDNHGLAPTFEAIHDAFSVLFERYAQSFRTVTHATFERLLARVEFPAKETTDWRDVPDSSHEYDRIVVAMSESLSGSARLDAVRLAMFLYSVGMSTPASMELTDPNEGTLNDNAAVRAALDNTKRYGLGHARSGRRMWSVTRLRRGA